MLHVNKFEDADFKYDIISVLKFQPKIPNYSNFGPKFKDFYFWMKFCV